MDFLKIEFISAFVILPVMKKFVLSFTLIFALHIVALPQKTTYKNLVLEGGGIRGFAYVGAFEMLDSIGILQQIEKVGGTSAGAIQAALLAVGYTTNEMIKTAANIPLKEFNDGFFPGGFARLKRRFGFFKGEKITAWIEQLIAAKTGDANITFLQLHKLRSEKNYKDLYITGTDLTNRRLRIFSYETYPDMRIKDALRISFSIPLYFEPVVINDSGRVQKNKGDSNTYLMVDGGLLANYPIEMFDQSSYTAADSGMNNNSACNTATLGLLLDKPEQLEYNYKQHSNYPLRIHSLRDYVSAVYQTIIDKPNPDKTDQQRTITISHLNLSGRVRKLSPGTIQKLVESGRQGVRMFFRS